MSCLQLLARRCSGCGYWVLTIEFDNESLSDIYSVRCIDEWNLGSIDDHIYVPGFCKHFQSFPYIFLQRLEKFCATSIVTSLRIFAFTLNVALERFQLIALGLY